MSVFAEQKSEEKRHIYTYYVKKDRAEDAKNLKNFLAGYLNALNAGDIKKTADYYAPNYISDDGFNKKQVIDLIGQTRKKYPDLKYSTVINNIRLQKNTASIEFTEKIKGTSKNKSDITKDTGCLTGISRNIFYLEKFGNGWAIVTDKALYEEAIIKYGTAKTTDVKLEVPEQVTSGEEYTALLETESSPDVFAMGSVTSMPIVAPLKYSEEMFKQISPSSGTLERIVRANEDSYNELVSASVSFCKVERTYYTSLELKVSGLAIVLKRVNVLPKRSFN